MREPGILGVRAVEIEVADLDAAADFYERVWRLVPVARAGRSAWFRGTGLYHHILALHETGRSAVRRIVLDAAGRDAVDRLHAAVVAAGAGRTEAPRGLDRPGGGYGFGFKDPDGRNYAVIGDAADHAADLADTRDRPRKIVHVNVNARDHAPIGRFLVDVLGFRLIDDTPGLQFFHCDSTDHGSLVVAKGKAGATINHVAFALDDLDTVMRGAGRMRDAGYPIEWGVGRHGAGNNVFAYFAGPEELPIEYTAEVLQIDDSYQPGGVDKWRFPPGRTDQWGVTAPPSPRLLRIQEKFRFTEDGDRLDG
jgi:catechol 2,3-dioxygenase